MKLNHCLKSSLIALVLICHGFECSKALANSFKSKKIEQAADLISAGKITEARAILATIPEESPEYRIGKFYDAVAIHTLDDQIGFLRALEALPQDSADVPPEVAEDMAWREVQSLHFIRKFEVMLPKARSFGAKFPDSRHQAVVNELLIVGLFDRGIKKTEDACRSNDEEVFNKRWPEAKSNLEEFLALYASNGIVSYQFQPKRNLQQDVLVARLSLGEHNVLLSEIPETDKESREKIGFLRLRLYQELQKTETDKNIQMAENFIEQFPNSIHRKRVEYELAGVLLSGGEKMSTEARCANDRELVKTKRESADRYLNYAGELYRSIREDREAGISSADVQQSQVAMVRIAFAKEDWDGLSESAESLVSKSAPKGKLALIAKLYDGAGKVRQGKLMEGAKILDEVLQFEFQNTPSIDGLLISAAGWRIRAARESGEKDTINRVISLVQKSQCASSIKRTFMKNFTLEVSHPISTSN